MVVKSRHPGSIGARFSRVSGRQDNRIAVLQQPAFGWHAQAVDVCTVQGGPPLWGAIKNPETRPFGYDIGMVSTDQARLVHLGLIDRNRIAVISPNGGQPGCKENRFPAGSISRHGPKIMAAVCSPARLESMRARMRVW
jgi:hypothetical protein